jgi:hypothetical protein
LEEMACGHFFVTAPGLPPAKSVVFAGYHAA